MNHWSLLPNAQLIDEVLVSLKSNPDIWRSARETIYNTICSETFSAAFDVALDVAHDAARNAAMASARIAARNAIIDADLETAWVATWRAARDSIMALVAYDDCDQYLNMTYEQLSVYAVLSEKPQALLLLSMKWIQEHETMVTTT